MPFLRRDIRNLWLYRLGQTRSIGITRWLAIRHGDRFGFVYVGGYPKSGTTWMSQLVAHYLDIPFPDFNALPLAFECVVHHHWDYQPALERSFQVVRDGRDVMVSLYMNLMKAEQAKRERVERLGPMSWAERALVSHLGRDAAMTRRLQRLLGLRFDPWDTERNLARFIEAEMQRPLIEIVTSPWPRYVREWRDKGAQTVTVRYEELLRDGPATLGRAMGDFLQAEADPEGVEQTIRRYAFARRTGRSEGEEDRRSFARKGVSGDWRNHFSREARQLFDHHAGDLLIELGYEADHSWVDEARPGEKVDA